MARNLDRPSGGRELYKYGICLNDECQKCKNKEVQKFPMRKDLVCEECGQPLRECPAPKAKSKGLIWGAVALLLGSLVCGVCLMKCGEEELPEQKPEVVESPKDSLPVEVEQVPVPADTIPEPSVEPVDEPEKDVQPTETVRDGDLQLDYATWYGPVKNGKPDGIGRMVYKKSHLISKYDSQQRKALAGEYIQGDWVNGELSHGTLYNSKGTVKCSLLIGVH